MSTTSSDDTDVVTADTPAEPEYVFEGYEVEFSRKVALTPPAAPAPTKPRSAA